MCNFALGPSSSERFTGRRWFSVSSRQQTYWRSMEGRRGLPFFHARPETALRRLILKYQTFSSVFVEGFWNFKGNVDGAMKTALHLTEYDDILDPLEIFSLLGEIDLETHSKDFNDMTLDLSSTVKLCGETVFSVQSSFYQTGIHRWNGRWRERGLSKTCSWHLYQVITINCLIEPHPRVLLYRL